MAIRKLSLPNAIDALRSGGVVAYPTETFYGLGAVPSNQDALDRLMGLKRRDANKPVSVILGRTESVALFAGAVPPNVVQLIEGAWPGPLTVILPARPDVHPVVTGGTGTVAMRVPSHADARHLADAVGGAITATSANRQGAPPPTTADEVIDQFEGDELTGVLDGGTTAGGAPSTLVRPSGRQLFVIRPGVVALADLREWWNGEVIEPGARPAA